jgi:heme/copper-type cytochrome/quinol oxidase subunit 2
MKLLRCKNWEWYYDYPCATTTATPELSGDFWDTWTLPTEILPAKKTTSELSEVSSKIWTSTRLTTKETITLATHQTVTSMTTTTVQHPTAETAFDFWPSVIITIACNIVLIILLIVIYKAWSRPKRYHVVKLDDDGESYEFKKRKPKRPRASRDSIVNDSRIYPGDSALRVIADSSSALIRATKLLLDQRECFNSKLLNWTVNFCL